MKQGIMSLCLALGLIACGQSNRPTWEAAETSAPKGSPATARPQNSAANDMAMPFHTCQIIEGSDGAKLFYIRLQDKVSQETEFLEVMLPEDLAPKKSGSTVSIQGSDASHGTVNWEKAPQGDVQEAWMAPMQVGDKYQSSCTLRTDAINDPGGDAAHQISYQGELDCQTKASSDYATNPRYASVKNFKQPILCHVGN